MLLLLAYKFLSEFIILLLNCQTLKDWIPIIGSAIVLLLFIVHRVIDYQNKTKDIERTWYMRILIEPHIQGIHQFYDSVLSEFNNSCQKLRPIELDDDKNFESTQSQCFELLQDLKRSFEGSFVLPIMMKYQDLGNNLTDLLLEIEDEFTKRIDERSFSKDDIQSFRDYLHYNKSRLLTIIYRQDF